ncbi:hypothetical protein B0H19DRAFT_1262984 [Mycena capillaripes]|nr:hypothetical protein B0H19DRAFT_1262984 [Mycena capillaripes]
MPVIVTSLVFSITLFFVLAADKAQAVSRLQEALHLSDLPSEPSGGNGSHSQLDFPDSDTPMAPPSETEELVAPAARHALPRKQNISELSKSETPDAPADKPAKKKPGSKPKAKAIPQKSIVPPTVPKKKAGPKATDDSDCESDNSVSEPVVKPTSGKTSIDNCPKSLEIF